MTPIIKKAQRGSADAFATLYQANKQHVLYLCNLLLCDEKAADTACTQIFKQAWDLVLSGTVQSEEEFSTAVEKKAAYHCKNKLSKSNNKTFRIPAGKNFAAMQYSESSVVTDGNVCDQILGSLPVLHRFIYVLHAVFDWSDEEIAELIHSKPDVVCVALDVEDMNISRITQCIRKKTGENTEISSYELHKQLVAGETGCTVSRAIDSIVLLGIDSLAAPIALKIKKQMQKIILISTAAVLALALLIFGIVMIAKNAGTDDPIEDDTYDDTIDTDTDDEITWLTSVESPTHYAIIDIADYGKITVALDGNSAPETVENFVALAEEGFYDGLTFHRIMEGFMMQGGDPDADGTGGHKDEDGNEINITGEFYYNGYDNYLSHVRGAISMARANDYDSASSQFFIVHEDAASSLDMLYAAFGYVIEGMDVVDAVCEAAEPTDDNGTIEYENQPVITSIMIYTPEEYEQLLADNSPDAEVVAIDAKIAEVTAINEGVLSLTVYGLTESGEEYEITDVKTVDFTNYEATEETEEYTIDSTTVIYEVLDGVLTESDSSEIVVGDMLVIDNGADEGVTIVVYHDGSEGEDTEGGDSETSGE